MVYSLDDIKEGAENEVTVSATTCAEEGCPILIKNCGARLTVIAPVGPAGVTLGYAPAGAGAARAVPA